MKKVSLILLVLVISPRLPAQTVKTCEITAEFFPADAAMYDNPVAPDAFMRAESKIELDSVRKDSIFFYLHGELVVDSILQNRARIPYTSRQVMYAYDYSMVALKTVLAGQSLKTDQPLEIYYSGFFNPSRARSLSDYMRINLHEGVFLRAYGYSPWFPVFQEPGTDIARAFFKHVVIHLPEKFRAVVCGEKTDERVTDNTRTVVWEPGLTEITEVQCTARDYEILNESNISIYHVRNDVNAAKILAFAVRLKKLYEDNLRKKVSSAPLRILEMPEYGNISSDNVIGLTTEIFRDFEHDVRSRLTVAHELVHPYVRIPVALDNPFYALVIEGFPSFFQVWALKRLDKTFDLRSYMKNREKQYIGRRESGKPPAEKPVLQIRPDEIGTYKDRFVLNDRVWLFFYDIWQQMGDNRFDEFLNELFRLDHIDYNLFESVVVKYLPQYRDRLNTWLNTTIFTENMYIH